MIISFLCVGSFNAYADLSREIMVDSGEYDSLPIYAVVLESSLEEKKLLLPHDDKLYLFTLYWINTNYSRIKGIDIKIYSPNGGVILSSGIATDETIKNIIRTSFVVGSKQLNSANLEVRISDSKNIETIVLTEYSIPVSVIMASSSANPVFTGKGTNDSFESKISREFYLFLKKHGYDFSFESKSWEDMLSPQQAASASTPPLAPSAIPTSTEHERETRIVDKESPPPGLVPGPNPPPLTDPGGENHSAVE